MLKENWKSAKSDYTGTSYNFYNTKTKQWQQVWVDNKGGNLQLSGGLVEKKMILSSAWLKNDKGEEFQHKLTWIPNEDGSVNQLWETLNKSGQVQKTLFNGSYRSIH